MLPFILFLLIGAAVADPAADRYMDQVLEALSNRKTSSSRLPDFSFNYITGTKLQVQTDYKEGTLIGLFKVVRSSECYGPTETADGISIQCDLKFSSLETRYKGHVKYGSFPDVFFAANAESSNTPMTVKIVQGPDTVEPVLDVFLLGELEPLIANFQQLQPSSELRWILEDNYREEVSKLLHRSILGEFQSVLKSVIAQFPLPKN